MKAQLSGRIFGLSVLLLAVAWPASGQTLAVVGGTVIDATGAAPIPDGVVLIENGRISAVGSAGDVRVPGSATVIDAEGKFVIPGLMDGNLHLYLNGDLETLIKYEGRYHEIVLEAAQIALKTGQTTVFDTWGPLAPLIQARDMINAGQAPGSRIYLAGNIIGFSGPLGPDFRGASAAHVSRAFVSRINDTWEVGTGRHLMWLTPDSLHDETGEYTTKGADFLKYGASGHVEMEFLSFSERQQRAIIEAGHEAGMTVQTHATSVESLHMAIEAGVDIVTHGAISGPSIPIPEETIQMLVDRDIAVSVLAITQRRLDALERENPGGVLTPFMKIGKLNRTHMIEAGVKLLVSTDAGIQNPVLLAESSTLASDTVDSRTRLGEGHFNALQALEEMGMAPMEVLRSATFNVAEAYELLDEIGTLETGKIADLVILNENPLLDARNYRTIDAVIKDGRVVDLGALPVAPIISSMKVEGS
jgi:imidazolonepropionase-like amidohydrolase